MIKIETGKQNEVLRTVSTPIKTEKFPKYTKIGKEMIKYIKNPKNGWVGLAAPQIGYNRRLIVVSLLKDWDDETYPTILMMNPEILEHSDEKNIDTEWCLSVPWEKWKVARWNEIKLKYIDEKWKENILKLSWLRARIVQHEIDHLDWILFTDNLI